tara:strand:+ start:207 stop:722 length:516 start_codon:yes stop_codon:yes gene_type:complete
MFYEMIEHGEFPQLWDEGLDEVYGMSGVEFMDYFEIGYPESRYEHISEIPGINDFLDKLFQRRRRLSKKSLTKRIINFGLQKRNEEFLRIRKSLGIIGNKPKKINVKDPLWSKMRKNQDSIKNQLHTLLALSEIMPLDMIEHLTNIPEETIYKIINKKEKINSMRNSFGYL